MIFSRRALSHPRSSYGKGIMIATSLFAALHMINIATQVSCAKDAQVYNVVYLHLIHAPWKLHSGRCA